jgi:hypothetical protein
MDYRNEFAVYHRKTIVLGYGGYEKIEKSLINFRFETLLTAIQYFHGQKQDFPIWV